MAIFDHFWPYNSISLEFTELKPIPIALGVKNTYKISLLNFWSEKFGAKRQILKIKNLYKGKQIVYTRSDFISKAFSSFFH